MMPSRTILVIFALIALGSCIQIPKSLDFEKIRMQVYPSQTAPTIVTYPVKSDAKPTRVCLVASHLDSYFKNVATQLTAAGHDVHVIIPAPAPDEHDFHVHVVESSPEVAPLNSASYAASLRFFNTLNSLEAFDVIFFEQGSLGFVSVEAKQSGIAFPKSTLVTSLLQMAPTTAPASVDAIMDEFMARRVAELADVVTASSQRILKSFCTTLGYKLTSTVYRSGDDLSQVLPQLSAASSGVQEEVEEKPLVSVIIPTYNRPKLLLQAVKSVDTQTYPNIQLVIVDDGSTVPQVDSVLGQLEKRENTLVIRQSNRYLGAARNRGSKEASGKFLLFLDDDNVAFPDMVATLVTAALKSHADVVVSAHTVWDEAAGETKASGQIWYPLGPAPIAGLFTNVFGNANFLIDRKIFIDLEGFTTDRMSSEDYEFHAKAVLDLVKYAVVPKSLMYYRIHDRQTQMFQQDDEDEAYGRALRPYANILDPEEHATLRKRTGPLEPECFILGWNTESCGAEITLSGRVYISGVTNRRRNVYAGLSDNIVPEVAVNNSMGGFKPGSTWRHNNNNGVTGNFQIPLSGNLGPVSIELTFDVGGTPTTCYDASGNSQQTIVIQGDQCCCYPPNSILGDVCAPTTLQNDCFNSGGMCWQGDFDSDGDVDVSDLATFLTLYGPCECFPCLADFDIDGRVGIEDLVQLLVRFGDSSQYAPTDTCCCKYSATDPSQCIPNVKPDDCVAPYHGCA